MKFDRAELLAALSTAAPALAKSPKPEGLDHFWFDKEFLYAYDGGLGIRVDLATDLTCGLPGRPLLDLLKTSALKEVELDGDEGFVTIQMGKSTTKLVSLDFDRFAWNFPEGWGKKTGASGGNIGSLSLTEGILEAVTRASFVRFSGKPQYTVHNGILVHPVGEDGVEFYATDSASMVRTQVSDVKVSTDDFVAPWGFVDRFLELAEPGESTLYLLDDVTINKESVSCLIVASKGVRICSNLLELQEEPDVPKTMAKFVRGEDDKFVDLPTSMQAVLDRAIILASKDKEKEAVVKINVKGKTLRVSGKYGLGEVDEEFPLKGSLPEASGLFKAEVVRRGLGQATGFSLTEAAMVIDDGDDICYVMAVKHERKEAKGRRAKAEPEEDEEQAPRSKTERRRSRRSAAVEDEPEERTTRRRNREAFPEDKPGERITRRRNRELDDEVPF